MFNPIYMNPNIKVCWSRRTSPKAAATTDENGYILMEFGFNTGERISVMALRTDVSAASMWQKIPFGSPAYLTFIEIWQAQDGTVYLYAYPEPSVKEKLP